MLHQVELRSDADLLSAHADGDPRAFGTLIARHRDRMWAVALRTMRDPEEAADALQDACISAFRAAGSFRAESAVTTWLHRIVVNSCLDRMRRRKARPTVPLEDHGTAEPAAARDAMADRELALDITAALDTLPEDQRLAVVLVDVQGYSVADAAAAMQVAEGTVKSRCARGRAKLAVQLGHLRNRADAGAVVTERGPMGAAFRAPASDAPAPGSVPGASGGRAMRDGQGGGR